MNEIFDKLEKFASSNDVLRVKADLSSIDNFVDIIELEDFLKVGLSYKMRQLYFTEIVFEIGPFISKFERYVINWTNHDEFKKYQDYDGEICGLKLYWIDGEKRIRFEFHDSWLRLFDEIVDDMTNYQNEKKSKDAEQQTKLLYDLANRIAGSEGFYAIHTRPGQIMNRIVRFLKEQDKAGDIALVHKLTPIVEELFKTKYFYDSEEIFKERVRTLQHQGVTKRAIARRLGSTEGLVDRFLETGD